MRVLWLKNRNNLIELLIVAAAFSVISIVLTNFVLFSGGSTLFTTGVGDATSGFLWLLYANEGSSLWGGTTDLINYPYGEQLGSPVYITWLFVLGPLWLLSLVMPPITALNVMMLVGFVSTGVAAYYLIKRVVRSRFVSFIGAYAITFVPYHILKAPDHLTNIFVWPLIGIIGFLIAFWRRQTLIRGAGLAFFIAAAVYTDGYYIFVAGVLILALFIGLTITDVACGVKLKYFAKKIGKLLVVGIAALALLSPILIVQASSGSEVSKDLANSRGDIKGEVRYYSSKPIDFLLPPQGNITVGEFDWYKTLVEEKNSRSNMGENTTYIGYVVLSLFIVGAGIALFKGARVIKARRRLKLKLEMPVLSIQGQVLAVCVIAVPLMLVWMLPPTIHALGVEIKTPIDVLTTYVALWRVPSRLFIALHLLIVIAAMIVLARLLKNIHGWKRWLILSVVLILVIAESYSNIKRPSFGLGDMPQTYSWLKTQDDIKSIAELPLIDWPVEVSGYYVFGQLIHDKKMVNTALARKDAGLLNPLGNLMNSETIDFLKARGVDAVLVHSRSCDPQAWGPLVHSERLTYSPEYIDKEAVMLCTYKLNKSDKLDPLFVYLNRGFVKQNYLDSSGRYWNPLSGESSEIRIIHSDGQPVGSEGYARVSFDIGVLGDYPNKDYNVVLKQQGKIIGEYSSTAQSIELDINIQVPLMLEVRTIDGANIAPGEVGISLVKVTKK